MTDPPGEETPATESLPVTEASKPRDEPLPTAFWPALLVGWGIITVGLLGVFQRTHHFAGRVPWKDVAKWTIGLAVVHDLFVAPAVCIIGLALSRTLPGRVRGSVQGALVVSALVTITAWPVVRVGVPLGDNPSVLPGNYGRGLLAVLSVIWFVALALVLRGVLLGRRRSATRAEVEAPVRW